MRERVSASGPRTSVFELTFWQPAVRQQTTGVTPEEPADGRAPPHSLARAAFPPPCPRYARRAPRVSSSEESC